MSVVKLNLAPDNRKKVAVISHERSGTHFLMNTLALNFGYITDPWWNFDFEHGLNFHAPHGLHYYLKQVHNQPVLNVLKSHHPIAFFYEFIDYHLDQFHVLYILRDPRNVMISNWKLINELPWDEGPKTKSVSDFMRAEPRGAMMRYQKKQEKNLLMRWKNHVAGWLDFAETERGRQMVLIKYEDLNGRFSDTVTRIGHRIGLNDGSPKRPAFTENVIGTGTNSASVQREHLSPADEAFIQCHAGDILKRTGYYYQSAAAMASE